MCKIADVYDKNGPTHPDSLSTGCQLQRIGIVSTGMGDWREAEQVRQACVHSHILHKEIALYKQLLLLLFGSRSSHLKCKILIGIVQGAEHRPLGKIKATIATALTEYP